MNSRNMLENNLGNIGTRRKKFERAEDENIQNLTVEQNVTTDNFENGNNENIHPEDRERYEILAEAIFEKVKNGKNS